MPLRIVFMGTPAFAVPTLTEIVGQGHDVAAVYTRAPTRSGRGMKERISPVHETAARFGIEVRSPRTLCEDAVAAEFEALDADLGVVAAYGLILPQRILDAPREGCLNLHASLLPRWRGAAPIQRAIMAGDAETGVAVMKMEAGLDTGPVATMERMPIPPEATAAEVGEQLARLGADLMGRALGAVERGGLEFTPQPSAGVRYADKISKDEARVDWSRPASEVHRHLRGLAPFPGAWCDIALGGRPERLKLLRCIVVDGQGEPGEVLDGQLTVACGSGAVRLLEVQRAGRGVMSADAFLRGARVPPGSRLG